MELYDCFVILHPPLLMWQEETPTNHMDATRRKAALVDRLALFKQEAVKNEKTRAGMLKLWEGGTRSELRA